MSMPCISNVQEVKLFDENNSTDWTFHINWLDKSILIHRGNIKLVKYTDCKFPPTVDYLQSLVKHFNTVRAQSWTKQPKYQPALLWTPKAT